MCVKRSFYLIQVTYILKNSFSYRKMTWIFYLLIFLIINFNVECYILELRLLGLR